MPNVQFFPVLVAVVRDDRRIIEENVLPENLPFPLRQCKDIKLTPLAVTERKPIGNHSHTGGREELYVALNTNGLEACSLFLFRYRNSAVAPVEVRELMMWSKGEGGEQRWYVDGVYIPPGCSHGFLPLRHGAMLRGFSNQPYDAAKDVADNTLFL